MANFGAGGTPFDYGKGLYDPYKNLVRPRGALTSLLGTQRSGTASDWTNYGSKLKMIFGEGTTATGTTAGTFEKAVQGIKDPTSLYSLAAKLVVGRKKYELAGEKYKGSLTVGGGEYIQSALKNILGLNWDYKTGKYK